MSDMFVKYADIAINRRSIKGVVDIDLLVSRIVEMSSSECMAVLDIQYFYIAGKHVIKEAAVYSKNYVRQETFAPPFSFHYLPTEVRRNVLYVEKNMGILWRWGYNDLTFLSEILKDMVKNFDSIYVKGREKLNIVSKYIDRAVLYPHEHIHCIRLRDPIQKIMDCTSHSYGNENPKCALNNACVLYRHLSDCSLSRNDEKNKEVDATAPTGFLEETENSDNTVEPLLDDQKKMSWAEKVDDDDTLSPDIDSNDNDDDMSVNYDSDDLDFEDVGGDTVQ